MSIAKMITNVDNMPQMKNIIILEEPLILFIVVLRTSIWDVKLLIIFYDYEIIYVYKGEAIGIEQRFAMLAITD